MSDDRIVYRYSRAQAIADGVLVDVTAAAQEAGISLPAVVTRGVWDYCIAWPADDPRQDETGRLRAVLTAASTTAIQFPTEDRASFTVPVVPRGSDHPAALDQALWVHVGPGDHGEPVLTIMLPFED
jgi:hypothetical protein